MFMASLPRSGPTAFVSAWCCLRCYAFASSRSVAGVATEVRQVAVVDEREDAAADRHASASMFEEIVGSSAPIRTVLQQVARVAPTDSTVLITGDTGTGKELIARAIHKRSARSGRPFVAVNCAAVPASLIASELFGQERGAFTGALQRRQGQFELAEWGYSHRTGLKSMISGPFLLGNVVGVGYSRMVAHTGRRRGLRRNRP
jgi:transcriptional regulator of aromatic amino acid metabolism